MQLYIAIITCLQFVTSNSHCVGTCYSGGLFPERQDIFHGKYLKGYSYNNITTDDPVKCYRHCVQDCRCKACQMKDARCELLDEDKISKADDFKVEPGYVYFDIKQTMYQGKQSHIVPPGVCYNGCCRSHPCMNGGTCVEKCSSPKEKFTCKCREVYVGKVCEKLVLSCMDIMKASSRIPKNGVFWIQRADNGLAVKIYCDFEKDRAWTLIESFSLEKNSFKIKPFFVNFKMNMGNPPSWDEFRMTLGRMSYIRSKSTLFRATCDFPNRVSLTPDLLIGRLSDVDIINETLTEKCRRYIFIDIMGHNCTDCKAHTIVGKYGPCHIHLDVSWNLCDLRIKAPENITRNTDSFGCYTTIDERSLCTATPQSTTQWWLGEEK